ncbi:WxL protein peptidoglycan domain-containing protein [Enterococcus ratti]|uniref:WxL Interacting Protein peptidoglycan binding domain-containing protein n=1 Tax=Enterococcus ratti TaxID=150033 RepID=A0A1L8WL30_9ENTE|nr:DUF916 domain-containing protein [Enterococcus ratti]OJG81731.1 hypothetical protein RV14_GL000258 [Enterococcus ratti]
MPIKLEKFSVLITNDRTQAKAYEIQVNKAGTNKNDIIDHSDQSTERTTKYKLTEMIQMLKKVTVKVKSNKKTEGSFSFPENFIRQNFNNWYTF